MDQGVAVDVLASVPEEKEVGGLVVEENVVDKVTSSNKSSSSTTTVTSGGAGGEVVSKNGDGGSSTTSGDLSEPEYSSDSGKGHSSVANEIEIEGTEEATLLMVEGEGTISPWSYAMAMIYEFEIPQHLTGRLIGRFGSFVNNVKAATGATIMIKRHHRTGALKICAVEGMYAEIELALAMIRDRFPTKKFPSITLEQVNFDGPLLAASMPFLPSSNKLDLIEGVINDIAVCCVVSLDHVFLQQPTHPTYSALTRLHQALKALYDQPIGAPKLSEPFNPGVICIAQLKEDWFRAEVVAVHEDKAQVTARLVDVGGYVQVAIDHLRQIRVDFVTIPFQACECRLANITPINEEEGWSEEAVNFFKILAQGHVLQATVVDYSARDNITLIHLYKLGENHTHIFINKELVNHGYAKWIDEAEYYLLPDQFCQNFAELGTVSPSAASPNDMGLSNPSWGDVSSSDEVTSPEAYIVSETEPETETVVVLHVTETKAETVESSVS